jgi:Leucine-rich repeat (LRR) protein
LSCLTLLNSNVEAAIAKGVKCEKIDSYDWGAPIGSVKTCFMNKATSIDSAGARNRSPKLDDVKGIIFDNNKNIELLPDNTGVVFPNLLAFSAQGCSILSIAYDNFKYMGNLVYLNLGGNQIASIDKETLSDLKNAQQIDLSKKTKVHYLN